MSRFHGYNNEFDEDDDGEDLEITEEEEAASDDEGREQAALLMAHCESIVGNRKVHEDQRRMWFRLAKKALAEGAERREAVEEQERAEREQEEAAERARVKAERAAKHDRELIERETRRAETRWRNAEAARMEAEAERARARAGSAEVGAPVSRPVAQVRPAMPIARPSAMPSPVRPASTQPTSRATVSTVAAHEAGPSYARGPAPTPVIATRPTPAARSGPSAQGRTVGVPAPAHPLARKPIQQSVTAVRTAPVPGTQRSPPSQPTETRPGTARERQRPLTGGELLRWRTQRGIAQRVAAEELGVAPSTVAKAELVPGKPLGEQLLAALRGVLIE